MHSLSLFLGLLTSATLSYAAVTIPSVKTYTYDGPVNPGSHIVKVRDDVPKDGVLSLVTSLAGGNTQVTHNWDSAFFNGFAGLLLHPRSCNTWT
jgi:hypothetical protein